MEIGCPCTYLIVNVECNIVFAFLFTRSRKVIPIKCNIPMDFEYQLKFVQPHPAITITPMTGTVPGNGQVELTATYSPSDFSTAIMKLQLIISQFNTKPLDCTFIGHSSPGLAM